MDDEKLEQILMALAIGSVAAKNLKMEEWQEQIEKATKMVRTERNEQFKKLIKGE